jgi:hypothetical protein
MLFRVPAAVRVFLWHLTNNMLLGLQCIDRDNDSGQWTMTTTNDNDSDNDSNLHLHFHLPSSSPSPISPAPYNMHHDARPPTMHFALCTWGHWQLTAQKAYSTQHHVMTMVSWYMALAPHHDHDHDHDHDEYEYMVHVCV